MNSSLRVSRTLWSLNVRLSSPSAAAQPYAITQRWGHSVRLIALEDLPHGKGYQGDVVSVKAGYARNYLIPQKKAVYATPQNFGKLGMIDPEFESEEERLTRLERESSIDKMAEQHLKQADLLKKYLRNKVLKFWRVADPNSVDAIHPGTVTALNIRQKLSKQLQIDLEKDETIHIHPLQSLSHAEMDGDKLQTMVDEFEPEGKCDVKIKRLGDYVAKIGLEGGHSVPLRFVVQQRLP